MGRLVLTHSTYINGLIKRLRLINQSSKIKTITPGEIKTTKGRSEVLRLRISTKIKGGYKIIARKGTSVQEVFIVTDCCIDELNILLG